MLRGQRLPGFSPSARRAGGGVGGVLSHPASWALGMPAMLPGFLVFVFNISDSASDACCLPSDVNTNSPAGSNTFIEGWRLRGQKERADGGNEIEVPSLVR